MNANPIVYMEMDVLFLHTKTRFVSLTVVILLSKIVLDQQQVYV